MQVAVLAGGLGTRLRDALPAGTPKPMAEVAGRPFLEHVLDAAIVQGADRFLLLVSHRAEVIGRHVGHSYAGVPVGYCTEPEPLGTGGALRHARGQLEPRFVLMNGDTFVDVDLRAVMGGLDEAPLTMALTQRPDTTRFGRVEVADGVVTRLTEKGVAGSGLINAGVYGCRIGLLDLLPEGSSSFEQDLMLPWLPRLQPRYVLTGPTFYDIGVPADYRAADAYFRATPARSTRTG
jgi:D-glycero-alpha-D-manno-heptose 1-phosphate guanylyltransferase